MAWMPSGILQGAEKVSHVLHSVTGTEASTSPVRGDAYFKAAIHVASGTDINPGDVPAVKILQSKYLKPAVAPSGMYSQEGRKGFSVCFS